MQTGEQSGARLVWTVCGALAALFLLYSQTLAFAWDEGFHLLTAQLIKAGERPYLDFLFPQPPLNAYWVAMWMRVFGDTWRTAQAASALESVAAVFLIADWVLRFFPVAGWRLAGAVTAILVFALNAMVVLFGTEGQAYGFGLVCVAAAFRCAVFALDRAGFLPVLAAGFFSGAAACGSLLVAPIAPVLLIWLLFYEAAGRVRMFAVFAAGVVIPWLPVIWLFVKSPAVVWFGLAGYNILYRRNGWGDPTEHDLDVLTDWIDSVQAMMVILLALAGLWFVARVSGWTRLQRAPFYLCAWLACAEALHLCLGRPTFARYFLFTLPFLAVLAAAGLYFATLRLGVRAAWPVALVGVLMSLGLGKSLLTERDAFLWSDFQAIADKVREVTPPKGTILADEHVYFLLHRRPPSGMELDYSHRLLISPQFAKALHVVLRPELDRQIRAGAYDTIATCENEKAAAIGIPSLYREKTDISECEVFWDFRR